MSPRYLLLHVLLWVIPACSEAPADSQTTAHDPSSHEPEPADDGKAGDAAAPGKPKPTGAVDAGNPAPRADSGQSTTPDASRPAEAGVGGGAVADDAGAAPDGQAGTAATSCDRACLIGVMQAYLDALVARDPSKLTVSSPLKYTDNGVVAKLGDGLWKTASALVKDARLDFADTSAGQVATHTVVNESGTTPVIYMVRLKVVDKAISEIESMTVRRQGAANGFFDPTKLVPEPAFLKPIDPAKRMTREAMNTTTELYLDYLEGKKKGTDVPFDMNCKRYENGTVTANGLSAFTAQSFWSFHVTRRTLVIDEEAGITWGMYPFEQSESALVVGEAFKLVEGKIMMIQAVMANQPTTAWK